MERWRSAGREPAFQDSFANADNDYKVAQESFYASSYEKAHGGDQTAGTLPSCQTAEDCGAYHVCSGGQCIFQDSSASSGQSGGSGGGRPGNTPCGREPDSFQDCDEKGCTKGARCSDGADSDQPFNCCGDPIYRCPGSQGPQCEPCGTPGQQCDDFCDNWYRANGTIADGCGRDSICDGPCTKCQGGKCTETSNGGCGCSGGNSGCGSCEKCEDNECVLDKNSCYDQCNCFVTCPCGKSFTGTFTQPHYKSGLACPSACRAALYQEKCVDQADQSCPPKKGGEGSCKADPGNDCEQECECKSQKVACSASHTCPDGYRCQVLGVIFAATGANGQCVDGSNEGGVWRAGGKTIILRVCKMSDRSDCEECDCNCENDCPDCEKCENGECVYDSKCDEPCNTPCNGECCDNGEECVSSVLYRVNDNCHNQGGIIEVPAGVSLSLQVVDVIQQPDAICNRYHTHCDIVGSNGKSYGTHLDCGRGLTKIGPGKNNICS